MPFFLLPAASQTIHDTHELNRPALAQCGQLRKGLLTEWCWRWTECGGTHKLPFSPSQSDSLAGPPAAAPEAGGSLDLLAVCRLPALYHSFFLSSKPHCTGALEQERSKDCSQKTLIFRKNLLLPFLYLVHLQPAFFMNCFPL